jgi:hypothetical protein
MADSDPPAFMPPQISKPDWDEVTEAAWEVANAATADDDVWLQRSRSRLMELLDTLDSRYGPHSWLVATRADSTEDRTQKEVLLRQAFELARREGDATSAGLVWESLSELEDEL